MNNRSFAITMVLIVVIVLSILLCACGSNDTHQTPQDPKPPVEVLPTAQDFVNARAMEVDNSQQQYDFYLNLSGSIGSWPNANANYVGKYRFDARTGDLKFMRTTSGILLYDATEYIWTNGDNRIKLVLDENGTTKKMSVIPKEDEAMTLINLPFVSVVNSLDSDNINNIAKNTNSTFSSYKYCATIAMASDNALLSSLLDKIGNLGTNIVIKNVAFANPQNGIKIYFNYSNGQPLTDFAFSTDLTFNFSGKRVTISLTYRQNRATSAINVPSTTGLSLDRVQIASVVDTIYSAVQSLKKSDAYSVDFSAINDFDPSATKNAIVDKYLARLYKNTTDGRVDFNHSYEYKSHTEEDGAETYKYTLGNIQDGSTYLISRKGTNQQTPVDGVSVDTQFDYLMSAIILNTNNIDCIKTVTEKDGVVKYYLYMNDAQTLSVQNIICDIINSNNEDGVLNVENYFNYNAYNVVNAEYVVTLQNGSLVSIECATKLKYNPVGGAYTDYNVTLKNSLLIEFNKHLSDAKSYTAPQSVNTTFGRFGLNNAKYYIL